MALACGLGGFPRRRAGDVLTPIGGATAAVPARCIPRCEKTGDPGDAVAAAPEVGIVSRVPFVQAVTEVDRVDGPLQRRTPVTSPSSSALARSYGRPSARLGSAADPEPAHAIRQAAMLVDAAYGPRAAVDSKVDAALIDRRRLGWSHRERHQRGTRGAPTVTPRLRYSTSWLNGASATR
jgi:hypothetical protein